MALLTATMATFDEAGLADVSDDPSNRVDTTLQRGRERGRAIGRGNAHLHLVQPPQIG